MLLITSETADASRPGSACLRAASMVSAIILIVIMPEKI
jgi:hypothetical protein